MYHLDSKVYFPKNEQYPSPDNEVLEILNDNGPITLVKGIKDLEEVSEPNSTTLFKLDGNGSPYMTFNNLVGIKVNFLGQDVLPLNSEYPTVDFFQYVILGRNSKALTTF